MRDNMNNMNNMAVILNERGVQFMQECAKRIRFIRIKSKYFMFYVDEDNPPRSPKINLGCY